MSMRIDLEVLSSFDFDFRDRESCNRDRELETETENCVEERENLRISMRIDLQVLSSFDLIITTSTSDSEVCECVSEAEEQMLKPKRRTTERERIRERA